MSFDVSMWRKRYLEAAKKIDEGKQAILQYLDEAEKLVLSGTIDLTDGIIRDEIWNKIAEFLFNHGLFSDCEHLNKEFMEILKFADPNLQIPRGQILYNIGISQINQRNYDEGIPNVLNAFEEDQKLHGEITALKMPAANIRENIKTFMVSNVDKEMTELKKYVQLNVNKKTTTEEILNVLPSDAERFLLAKAVNTFQTTPFRSDIYSKVLMFNNLKILCLLLENSLRVKGKGNTIKPLIDSVFKGEDWLSCFNGNYSLTDFRDPKKSDALQKFEDRLKEIENRNFKKIKKISNQGEFLLYAFLKSTLLRHLTAHLFDINASILSNHSNYKSAFRIVMLSLLYSLHSQS